MKKLENHKNYNCIVTTDTEEQFHLYANWLHNNDCNYFQGWECEAGITRLHIDKNLNVFSGECKNNFLGDIENFSPLETNICARERCTGCTDDLIVAKQMRV